MALVECRECGREVSTSADACPHCGMPDPTGQDLKRGACYGCGAEIEVGLSDSCPECGISRPLVSLRVQKRRRKRRTQTYGPSTMGTVGIIGAVVLFIGAFLPIVSMPMVGSINYFQNGEGDGVILVVLALITVILALLGKAKWLWTTGLASVGLLLFTFARFRGSLSNMREQMNQELEGNPFQGIADVAMESIQLQLGWAVLLLGALLVAGAGMRQWIEEEG